MNDDRLNVGDILKDNDPRMPLTRALTVVKLLTNYVSVKDHAGRVFQLARKRIYTDEKQRRTGFTRIGRRT